MIQRCGGRCLRYSLPFLLIMIIRCGYGFLIIIIPVTGAPHKATSTRVPITPLKVTVLLTRVPPIIIIITLIIPLRLQFSQSPLTLVLRCHAHDHAVALALALALAHD